MPLLLAEGVLHPVLHLFHVLLYLFAGPVYGDDEIKYQPVQEINEEKLKCDFQKSAHDTKIPINSG